MHVMRATLEALAAILVLLLAYSAVSDDPPVITTRTRIQAERIDAARTAINATNPAPCTAERMK